MLQNSWNRSIRLMLDVPLRTHRYLLEPVARVDHVTLQLAKLFLGFVNQIKKSHKPLMVQLLDKVKYDVRSTTGKNLRMLMLLTKKTNVDQISKEDYKRIDYHKISVDERWRVYLIEEMIDYRYNQIEIKGFEPEEIHEMLNFVCTT